MTKRKGKSSNKQDDSLALLEPSVARPRGIKDNAVPAAIFFIFIVGGSTAVWFCSQQQQTIDSLTETVNAMQLRVTKFQQQLGLGNAQITNVAVFEERLQALEEAYTQAQKEAEVTLGASEKIKSTDLHSQVWTLQSEMNAKLTELQQTTVSTATFNGVIKNKTEELEKLKQRLNSVLSANSEVAVSISGLTDTVLVTTSRLDEQMSAVEGLTSLLEQQRTKLASLRESFADNQKTLERNRQEVIDIKDLLEMEQARRSQALEDQFMSVRRSLEDHQKSTHSLHSHLAAQIEIVQSQMLSQSQQPASTEEEIDVKEQRAATEVEEVTIKGEEFIEEENRTVNEEEANAVDVVEDHVTMEKEEPAEDVQVLEEAVEEQAEEDQTPEVHFKKEDVADRADEVQFMEDDVEKQGVTEQEAIPEEVEVKEDVVKDLVVSEEEEIVNDQEDVIPEDVQVKDGDVAEEQGENEEDEAPEEVQVHGEEAEEQTEEALAKHSTVEEAESNISEDAAPTGLSDDQLVEAIKQEESQQKFLEETGEQLDSEEEEPAVEFVDELNEQDFKQ
ncbi:probable serine/threonine-protein kinase kinX [Triplophysa rosa]|nr:probable serine/threonine-protein kinase kinX [Triplophysa rosa]